MNASQLLGEVDRSTGNIGPRAELGRVRATSRRSRADLLRQKRERVYRVEHRTSASFSVAVRRRSEPIWSRIDAPTKTFLLSLNGYTSTGRDEAIAAMATALDNGVADHVVVDMRYLRGGDGSQLFPIVTALESDQRVNRPDGPDRSRERIGSDVDRLDARSRFSGVVRRRDDPRARRQLPVSVHRHQSSGIWLHLLRPQTVRQWRSTDGDRTGRPGRTQQRGLPSPAAIQHSTWRWPAEVTVARRTNTSEKWCDHRMFSTSEVFVPETSR